MENNTGMNAQNVHGAYQHEKGDIKSLCKQYMHYHVVGQTRDGSQFDGIITDMDDENVSMLVPEWVDEGEQQSDMASRQFGYGGYGYGRRFRRFRPRIFPFFFFRPPFFRPFPYPYYYPYY